MDAPVAETLAEAHAEAAVGRMADAGSASRARVAGTAMMVMASIDR
jgi:hypothetical protein